MTMRIHDYLDYWAARTPDVVYAFDGSRSVTWEEMRQWTHRVGNFLALELEPEARFAVLSKNSLDILAVYFGASRAGVVPVPLNFRLAPPEWAFILEDAGTEMLIAEAEFIDAIDEIRAGLLKECCAIGTRRDGWRSFDEEVSEATNAPPGRRVSTDQPLYQMYTSGTTGRPKGAVLSHRAVAANVHQIQTGVRIFRKNALIVMPLFHAGSAVGAFMHAASGLTSRIVRDFDAGAVLKILRDEGIALATLVPAMIQLLVQHPDASEGKYPELELVLYGASPIASEVLRHAMDVFGCDFVQAYGMTETSAVATNLDREDHLRALQSDPKLLLSAGRPLLGTEIRIVDSEDRNVPVGTVGEVLVRGPQLMTAYWNRSEVTAEALRDGWMHTGDAAYTDDAGYVFISDRVKDMIVSGGENVYPREIEEVIFTLPGVNDAAVIGIPDERWGEVPKAIIVPAPGCSLTAEAVIEHCRAQLAKFKCPASVEFIGELPRTATGKVLKRELRAPYWEAHERAIG